jgi:hypothetical protein
MLKAVNYFHLLFVAPLLIYVGYEGPQTNPYVFKALIALGIGVAVYHASRAFVNK